MRLTVNEDSGKLINGFSFPEAIADNRIEGKRGDSKILDFQFGRPFGTSEVLTEPLTLKFGAKVVGDNDGSYVVSNFDQDTEDWLYEKLGEAEELVYRLTPGWNTKKLNNLLGNDPLGFAEETEIRCAADIAGSLHQKFFILQDRNGSVGVWFDIDAAGAAAPAGATACDRAIKVNTVLTAAVAADVAAAIAAVLEADAEFSAEAVGSLVSVEDQAIGARDAADAGDSGFVVTRWIAGSLPNTMVNVPYVDLDAEVERTENGVVTSTLTFTYRVQNDINKGTEGIPKDANPAYPAPATIATRLYIPFVFFGEAIDEQVFGYLKANSRGLSILGMQISAQEAPSGAALTIDLVTTAGAEQTKIGALAADAFFQETIFPAAYALAAAAALRLKIKSVGSAFAGSGLNVILIAQPTA